MSTGWGHAYVIDTSVVLTYLLTGVERPQDPHGDAVAFIAHPSVRRLIAPTTLLQEVIGGIASYRRSHKIGLSEADTALAGFLGLEIELVALDYSDAPRLAELGANLSIADATFVYVAEQLGVPLVTQDGRMRSGARIVSKAVVIDPAAVITGHEGT